MLTILLAVVFLGLTVFFIAGLKRHGGGDGWWFGVILFPTLLIIFLAVVVPASYAANSQRIAELKALQEANLQNYGIVVAETKAIISSEEFLGKLVAGSLEKIDLGKSASERLKEWRDEVNKYNLEVAGKKRMRTLWFYPGWVYMPAEINELPLLIIK